MTAHERGQPLLLASRSPRRAELLRMLGADFACLEIEVDESPRMPETPADYVRRIALAKVAAARARKPLPEVILAADTTVALNGQLFGKPADRAAATAMLKELSGRWHAVYTAVVVDGAHGIGCAVVASCVEFAELDDAVIEAYWRSGEPRDKAGAYGIQGLGGALVRRIVGSYGAVVGLPLDETRRLLDAAGVRHALSR